MQSGRMTETQQRNARRIYRMAFAKLYPSLVAKAERKGRSREEVDRVIRWLTGYDAQGFAEALKDERDTETFFARAPRLNPKRALIKGTVCGVRLDEIEDPLMLEIRYLDKLVDELARGKAMEKILRE